MRHVSRALDDEHRTSLSQLERFERALGGRDAELTALARPLLAQIDSDVEKHFRFEEEELFPRLRDAGDDDIATLLADEHEDIRALSTELRPLLQALAEGGLAAGQRADLKRLGLELIERMVAHIQKETMGLLPMLEDLLDDDTDRELALAYAGT